MAPFLLGCLALLAGAHLAFRVVLRRAYRERGHAGATGVLLQLLVCGLYVSFPFLYLPVPWPQLPPLPESLAWRLLGFGLGGLGVAVIAVAMVELGLRRLLGLGSPAVEEGGLYGRTRNPQVLGFFLYATGFAVHWPSWYALGWLLLFLPVFHMMVRTEEEYLLQVHGESYRRYCARVPRYLPFLRQ